MDVLSRPYLVRSRTIYAGIRSSGQLTTADLYAQSWQGPHCAIGLRATGSSLPARRWAAGPAPAGLRPELVPSVEVVKVLPTGSNPAVL